MVSIVLKESWYFKKFNPTLSQNLETNIADFEKTHKEDLSRVRMEQWKSLVTQQEENRKKLLYEYSKQEKLEADFEDLQKTMNQ